MNYINLLTNGLLPGEFFLTYPMSKAFDKVWYDGLIYKLKQNRVKGNLPDNLTNFINDRKL